MSGMERRSSDGEQNNSIRVVIIDGPTLVRESMVAALKSDHNLDVSDISTSQEVLVMLDRSDTADVIVLDHSGRGGRSEEFLSLAPTRGMMNKILVIADWISDFERKRLAKRGVCSVFMKHRPLEEFVQAIETIATGSPWNDGRPPQPAKRQGKRRTGLSEQERRVTDFVVEGLSNKEIGARLCLSESYVKSILQRVFLKVGVRSRGQLILAMLTRGANGSIEVRRADRTGDVRTAVDSLAQSTALPSGGIHCLQKLAYDETLPPS